ATQLARSTYLLLQCRELGARVVGALTMVDEAGAAAPDARALGKLLDCDVIAVTARTKRGLAELSAAIDRALRAERRARWEWTPSSDLRAALDAIRAVLPVTWRSDARYGATLPAADDAVALWALTCIESGPHHADALAQVPTELRAAAEARAARAA